MTNILITGSSGNVGSAVMRAVSYDTTVKVYATGHRLPLKAGELYFNFEDIPGTKMSLQGIDVLFLLRPPHISDTKRYFRPLIDACVDAGVKHIVFLSVQGAERSSIIPHHRIEEMIRESGLGFTFIRPSYFMQNLTTMLRSDIRKHGVIFLPAGSAKFLWVDVDDVGAVVAKVLLRYEDHVDRSYTVTGSRHYSFAEVAELLTRITGKQIRYVSPNLLRFFIQKRSQGLTSSYILVMILLHYLARFEKQPQISNDVQLLTGREPRTLEQFIEANKGDW